MIFLSLGHKVTAIEQSKILFYLVKDALNRAESKLSFIKNLDFRFGNSIDLYKTIERPIDIIYLDGSDVIRHKLVRSIIDAYNSKK